MQFNIRQLNYSDMAPMAKIISKMGVAKFAALFDPETVKALMGDEELPKDKNGKKGEERNALVEKIGIGIMFEALTIFLENFEHASDDIAAWLGSVAGMTADQVKALPLGDTFDLVEAVFSAPEFSDFFTRASRFAKARGGANGRASFTVLSTTQSPSSTE